MDGLARQKQTKDKQVLIRVTESQQEKFKKVAEMKNISVSELIINYVEKSYKNLKFEEDKK